MSASPADPVGTASSLPAAPPRAARVLALLDHPCSPKEVLGAGGLADALGLADDARLAPLEPLCHECPARVAPRAFGCAVEFPLPIEPDFEEWALTLLPADLGGTAGRWLLACFDDGPFDGRRVLPLRKDKALFASRPSALREWKSPALYVTSEQVLEPLLFNDAVLPSDAVKLALLFGLLDPALPYERAQRAVEDPRARRSLLAEAALPDVPERLAPAARRQAEALLFVLDAVRLAGRLDAPLAVWLIRS